MINQHCIDLARTTAKQLLDNGKALKPIANTALAEAVNTNLDLFHHVHASTLREEVSTADGIVETIVSAANESNEFGQYEHDEKIAEIGQRSSDAIAAVLELAKTKVIPTCLKVLQDYEGEAGRIDNGGLVEFIVDESDLNPLFKSDALRHLAERYRESQVAGFRPRYLNIKPNGDTIMDLLRTRVASFDQLVESAILPAEAINVVKHLYDGSFQKLLSTQRSDMFAGAILFLAARNLVTQIPEGLNINLDEYQAYMAQVVALTGRYVCASFDRIETERRLGNLVLDISRSEGETRIFVDPVIWQQALQQGLDTEALFGSVLQSGLDSRLRLNDLVANADQYRRTFTAYMERTQTERMARAENMKLKYLQLALMKVLPDLVGPEDMQMANARMTDAVGKLSVTSLETPFLAIRKSISEAIYPTMGLDAFLTVYDEVAEAVDTQEPEEISALAAIYYVADWACSQFEVIDTRMEPVGL